MAKELTFILSGATFSAAPEVVPGPTHLGINKMKFDFRRGDDGIIHVTIK